VYSTRCFGPILTKFGFSRHIFQVSPVSNSTTFLPMGAALLAALMTGLLRTMTSTRAVYLLWGWRNTGGAGVRFTSPARRKSVWCKDCVGWCRLIRIVCCRWKRHGMSMCRWQNETDRASTHACESQSSTCHLVHHKCHMKWPGIETGPRRWDAGD